jgi:endo-alpha-1,4-polygalactosaminidase (GH114 family)
MKRSEISLNPVNPSQLQSAMFKPVMALLTAEEQSASLSVTLTVVGPDQSSISLKLDTREEVYNVELEVLVHEEVATKEPELLVVEALGSENAVSILSSKEVKKKTKKRLKTVSAMSIGSESYL